jgi:protein-S-isoprenylcysteine O-methyltransferase Ste14
VTAVWSLVRKPVFFAYLALGLGGAILFGIVFSFAAGM